MARHYIVVHKPCACLIERPEDRDAFRRISAKAAHWLQAETIIEEIRKRGLSVSCADADSPSVIAGYDISIVPSIVVVEDDKYAYIHAVPPEMPDRISPEILGEGGLLSTAFLDEKFTIMRQQERMERDAELRSEANRIAREAWLNNAMESMVAGNPLTAEQQATLNKIVVRYLLQAKSAASEEEFAAAIEVAGG